VGASDSAAVLSKSKWENPLSVWLQKQGLADSEESQAMKEGTRVEPVILEWFRDESGFPVSPSGLFLVSTEYPWMHANLDGVVQYGNDMFEPVEAKYSVRGDEWRNDEVPDAYYIQVQHQLVVTGADVAHLVCWVPGSPLKHFVIERDEETMRWIIDGTQRFFSEHMEKGVAPELSEVTYDQARSLYPTANDDTVILPGGLAKAAQVAFYASKLKKRCEDMEKMAKAVLMKAVGSYRYGVVGDFKIDWRNSSRGGFDMETFSRNHPELVERYQKRTHFRTFTIKETNENTNVQKGISTYIKILGLDTGDIDEGPLSIAGSAAIEGPSEPTGGAE